MLMLSEVRATVAFTCFGLPAYRVNLRLEVSMGQMRENNNQRKIECSDLNTFFVFGIQKSLMLTRIS